MKRRRAALRGLVDSVRMSHEEYRANLNGLNIFFGAVLGFVLAGMEGAGPKAFTWMLFMTSGTIIGILYVSASRQRLVYLILAAFLIYQLPRILKVVEHSREFPPNLQPTLAVWLAMTALVEFLPRKRNEPNADPAREFGLEADQGR
jgi:hypothetical protein